MAATAGEESGVGSSSEGTPSTSPPYWDIDDDDDGRVISILAV
ncbi:hypothetical protein TIFTF001_053928 [Ficus carica]|uniref:Uncharacterized protein n=1 Tax=Ficus carica TaxID=3494 RepID=A0AA88DFN5_FICCA|nr:hypothetical protein TIFTF001_022612 [Ficus carica]GMN74830.1 hypothetical protein TIFTF001_053928 [Ficus carica]